MKYVARMQVATERKIVSKYCVSFWPVYVYLGTVRAHGFVSARRKARARFANEDCPAERIEVCEV